MTAAYNGNADVCSALAEAGLQRCPDSLLQLHLPAWGLVYVDDRARLPSQAYSIYPSYSAPRHMGVSLPKSSHKPFFAT